MLCNVNDGLVELIFEICYAKCLTSPAKATIDSKPVASPWQACSKPTTWWYLAAECMVSNTYLARLPPSHCFQILYKAHSCLLHLLLKCVYLKLVISSIGYSQLYIAYLVIAIPTHTNQLLCNVDTLAAAYVPFSTYIVLEREEGGKCFGDNKKPRTS